MGFHLDDLEVIGYPKRRFSFYVPLSIRPESDGVEISWTQGTLQSKNGLSDPWSDLTDARSPYMLRTTDLSGFFRVRPE